MSFAPSFSERFRPRLPWYTRNTRAPSATHFLHSASHCRSRGGGTTTSVARDGTVVFFVFFRLAAGRESVVAVAAASAFAFAAAAAFAASGASAHTSPSTSTVLPRPISSHSIPPRRRGGSARRSSPARGKYQNRPSLLFFVSSSSSSLAKTSDGSFGSSPWFFSPRGVSASAHLRSSQNVPLSPRGARSWSRIQCSVCSWKSSIRTLSPGGCASAAPPRVTAAASKPGSVKSSATPAASTSVSNAFVCAGGETTACVTGADGVRWDMMNLISSHAMSSNIKRFA